MSSLSINGIDLFAGAGGLALGARLAGITVTHAIENNRSAAETYRRNHPQTKVIERDIRVVPPLTHTPATPLVLFGGPPCQGFSTSNQRTRTLSNPKNWLFTEFFRFAHACAPDWIVLENVKGLRETAQGKFEALIKAEFAAMDYDSAIWTLGAAGFGVPQRRYRLFFVGRRKGRVPPAPPTSRHDPITVRQAIADLPLLQPGASADDLPYRPGGVSEYARCLRRGLRRCVGHLVSANNRLVLARYRHIPAGGNWRDIPARLMRNYTNLLDDRSRHTGIYRRLEWDLPSVVIANYRKNMLIHPEQHRGLSVREAARLQSFPDDYSFAGTIGLQQQQVSNAVPPLLAKAVFDHLIAHT